MTIGEDYSATPCYKTPKTVTLAITHVSPLCTSFRTLSVTYAMMNSSHEHGGRAPGREETGWTLSRWWIR